MTARVISLDLDALGVRLAYAVWRLRQDVFVVEQDCPYPDLDGRDLEPATRHLLLVDGPDDDPVLLGYARVLDEEAHGGDGARVGRVVLARTARGRGLADLLVHAALEEVGDRPSRLDAQAPLARWYAGFGYVVDGPEFLEDGIPHVPMARPAAQARQ